ncbi:MAG: glycosyltransferase [Coriobacteriia bacterium]|nr:glycosyltransferase [Coriobacteriia bacterium]
MARVDLHVHTRYSDHPSEWFLQRLGASESYTEPEEAYRLAKQRGMDFVAITDHNRIDGALELKERHPGDVIVGVEATTYFPEDGCKVHLLLWGITEAEFGRVQELRSDIYALREYVTERDIAHAVAHATFSVNGRLTADHLERLLLLFRAFETINGSRTRRQNSQWNAALEHVTPRMIVDLARKHRIEPLPDRPWFKGCTGGSDDHAGLLIGRTWTEAEAGTPGEFVDALRRRDTTAAGRHNDYRALAFSVYKIALDFSQRKSVAAGSALSKRLTANLFGVESGMSPAASVTRIVAGLKAGKDPLAARFLQMSDDLEHARHCELDKRFDIAYDHIARGTGELLGTVLEGAREALARGDMTAVAREVSAVLSAGFLAAPFFTTLGALSRGRAVAEEFVVRHGLGAAGPRRVLWFTDTVADLNGVSITLQQVARIAAEREDPLHVITCAGGERTTDFSNVVDLPAAFVFPLPHYESYVLGVPSPLESLRIVQALDPDEIIVSTPGPAGLLGVAIAKLLDVRCRFVYHTDYGGQLSHLTDDDSAAELVDAAVHWLCRQVDEVLVPSSVYRERLGDLGIDQARIAPFRRGIDSSLFAPRRTGRHYIQSVFGVPEGPTLLYTGRISQEKLIDVVVDVYERLTERHPTLNLLIVGDGPYRTALRDLVAHLPRVFVPGALPNDELPPVYSACDVLVFPSRTDTFGMSVLEAQACGTPAIVSDAGGPQEIVVDGVTGVVVRDECLDAWTAAVESVLLRIEREPAAHLEMCSAARARGLAYDWHAFLDELTGVPESMRRRRRVSEFDSSPV